MVSALWQVHHEGRLPFPQIYLDRGGCCVARADRAGLAALIDRHHDLIGLSPLDRAYSSSMRSLVSLRLVFRLSSQVFPSLMPLMKSRYPLRSRPIIQAVSVSA